MPSAVCTATRSGGNASKCLSSLVAATNPSPCSGRLAHTVVFSELLLCSRIISEFQKEVSNFNTWNFSQHGDDQHSSRRAGLLSPTDEVHRDLWEKVSCSYMSSFFQRVDAKNLSCFVFFKLPRYSRKLAVADLYRLPEVVAVREQGGSRLVCLLPGSQIQQSPLGSSQSKEGSSSTSGSPVIFEELEYHEPVCRQHYTQDFRLWKPKIH